MLNLKISILGAGWLGQALAVSFKQAGAIIKLSTRSESKLEELNKRGFETFLFNIEDGSTFNSGLFDSDYYIICISGVLNENKGENYWYKTFSTFFTFLGEKNPKKILLMSSIGVIPNACSAVSELDIENLSLVQSFSSSAEQALSNLQQLPGYIFRLGGLIGPGRDLAKHFTGKKDLPNGGAPVNLIHLTDLKSLIKKAIQNSIPNKIIHVVNPQHPSREKYYTNLCKLLSLPSPEFIPSKENWKIVSSVYLDQFYQFKIDLENLKRTDFITSI